MSNRRTLVVLVGLTLATILAGWGVLQLGGFWKVFKEYPPPTRAELRTLWEAYPDSPAWVADRFAAVHHHQLGLDLRLVLGEELPPPAPDEHMTLDGFRMPQNQLGKDLEERLQWVAEVKLVSLDEYSPPAGLPRFGHLQVDDVLGVVYGWEVPEEDLPALREALTAILDTRLEHPGWPYFYSGTTDVLYAVAWLEHLGEPLDEDRRARILAQLASEVGEGIFGQDFTGPWSSGGAPVAHAVALMHRVGVPDEVDLDELRREQNVY